MTEMPIYRLRLACLRNRGNTDPHHDVVVSIPWELGRINHGCSNERRKESAQGVARVQETLNRVGLVHLANPRTEARISQAVAEAAQHIADDKDGVRGVQCQGNKSADVTDGGHDCHTSLAKLDVNPGIGEGSDGVAGKGREED